jgi:hypothetical protein
MRIPKKYEGNNIINYLNGDDNIVLQNIILPKEHYDPVRSDMEIKLYISKFVKDPDLKEKTIKYFEQVAKKVSDLGGTTKPLWSMGGTKEENVNKDLLNYVEIKLNGLAILEPIGQINNAMFILPDNELLEQKYRCTRDQLTKDPDVYKISHTPNKEYSSYRFDGIGILEVIDAINSNKEKFLDSAKPQNLYSNLTRVLKEYQQSLNDEER